VGGDQIHVACGQCGSGRAAKDVSGESGGLVSVEWFDSDLMQLAFAAQVCAQAAERMTTPNLVVPVDAENQERALRQDVHQCGQKLEGGVIGPLQVIPIEDRGLVARDRLQRAANGFEQSRAIASRWGRAKLGQK
jgi:hypothetical protein